MRLSKQGRLEAAKLRRDYELAGADVPRHAIELLAQRFGVHPRTLSRAMVAGSSGRKRFDITDEHLVLIRRDGGAKAAWRNLTKAGLMRVGYEQFVRAYRLQIPKAVRVGIRTNDMSKMRKQFVYSRYEVGCRNESLLFDHFQAPNWVIGPKGVLRPWFTLAQDEKHRLLVAMAVVDRTPNSDVCSATAADAMLGHTRPDGTFIGGKFGRLRWDRGSDWLSAPMTKLSLDHGMIADPTQPRAPHEKGKVERVGLAVKQEFCPGLYGYRLRPPVRGEQIIDPVFEPDDLPTLAEFTARFAAWVETYNWERPHSALGGLTPGASYSADTAAIERFEDPDLLRPLFIRHDKSYTVGPNGIWHAGQYYADVALDDMMGRKVFVGWRWSGDELYVLDQATGDIATARPAKDLSASRRGAMLASRDRSIELVRDVSVAADLARARADREKRRAKDAKEVVAERLIIAAIPSDVAARGAALLRASRSADTGEGAA